MDSVIAFLLVIAVILVAAAWLGEVNNRRFRASQRQKLRESFGKIPDKTMPPERYARVGGYYARHHGAQTVDDITWNDLEMDEIYHRIDSTRSAAGEEYLYAVLRSPALSEEAQMIDEDAIACFSAQGEDEEAGTQTRIQMQMALEDLGHTGRFSLYDYLDQLDQLGHRSNLHHYVCLALPFVCIAIMFLNVGIGVVLLVASLIFNMISYLREKAQIEPYLVSFRYLLRLLQCGDRLQAVPLKTGEKECPSLVRDLQTIGTVTRKLSGFRRGSSIVMAKNSSGNPLDIVLDYIRMLFHLDLMKFNSMLEAVKQHQSEIDQLAGIVGKIDTEIAVASFRASLPVFCTPIFPSEMEQRFKPDSDRVQSFVSAPVPAFPEESGSREGKTDPGEAKGRRAGISYRAKGLYHPLLKQPVPNDLAADRSILLTGSNASGKSTFLKAAALGALLGQTILTVCARAYEGERFRIYSSMALRDSIQEGDSYFMVEIKSLKRIVDAANDPAYGPDHPVLCCIDEVLRGTNTIERIAASSEVLEQLAQTGALCFAATHDIELADLLSKEYENYHFEEELRRNEDTGRQDVVFSYQIHPGKAMTRNAIRLLGAVGFDADLTRAAKARAEHFEQTGRWE